MLMKIEEIHKILKEHGLKITPQRIAVYEALCLLGHPYAEDIVSHVRKSNPNISVATIYNTLEHFKAKNLLCKLETCQDKMRYDAGMKKHYHICNPDNDMMIDYSDAELDNLLKTHFDKKNDIKVTDIKLLIIGSIK